MRKNLKVAVVLSALLGASCGESMKSVQQTGETSESYPILFVTQVPISGFAAATSVFANHISSTAKAPKGGDLHIVYPDGTDRNLTREAGFGQEGLQGDKAIAVREPSVHWSGTKALFSMSVGAPAQQYKEVKSRWQIYEITGLGRGETARISLIPNQPKDYNNVSPIYGTDDRIIFTSDRPRDGRAHLHPQLDEYESTASITGIWSLDAASGDLKLLNHTPSGAFSPSIDSAGRVIFTRWDHLQRDQQADDDRFNGGRHGSFNYVDESESAQKLGHNDEVFPEARTKADPKLGANVAPHRFNQFFPWMINEDGTTEETLNHVGRHEFGGTYIEGSFTDDANLTFLIPELSHKNREYLQGDGGVLQIAEDPRNAGIFYGTKAGEFGTNAAGTLLRFQGALQQNADDMTITALTRPEAGHFRNPLPRADGSLIAAHTTETREDANEGSGSAPHYRYAFRLKKMIKQGDSWVAGEPLTSGFTKDVRYYDPDQLVTVRDALWELDPVEVKPRQRPASHRDSLPAPERAVFQKKGIDPAQLSAWLRSKGLALIVSRNVTARDRADVQQPFNLRVPGGTQTIGKPGKVYDVAQMQIFQADLIRGYNFPGRRSLAQPLRDGLLSSVQVGKDGSVAAIVPATRALVWQLADPKGEAVVRERNWISLAPGEIRSCPVCHGINTVDQAGRTEPLNEPEALGTLLDSWLSQQ